MKWGRAAVALVAIAAASGCAAPPESSDPAVAAHRELISDAESAASRALGRLRWQGDLAQSAPLRIEGACVIPVGERVSSDVTSFADDADELLNEINAVLDKHGYSQAASYEWRNGHAVIVGVGPEGATLRVRVKQVVRVDVLMPADASACS